MRVRLTRKLAECLDDVDVSRNIAGDLLTLDQRAAELLIAEGWAVPLDNFDLAQSAAAIAASPVRRPLVPSK